jgi:hypothetical protein
MAELSGILPKGNASWFSMCCPSFIWEEAECGVKAITEGRVIWSNTALTANSEGRAPVRGASTHRAIEDYNTKQTLSTNILLRLTI